MFELEKIISYRDADASLTMTTSAIIDVMQDVINAHSDAVGRGIDYMYRVKRAWFLVGWNIQIKRLPKIHEKLVIKTWPRSVTASLSSRNIIFFDASGEAIVCADSTWALMDIDVMRPTRIKPEDIEPYGIEDGYPMEDMGRRIAIDSEPSWKEKLSVRRTDIDFNGHMGNANYVKYASEYIPEGVVLKGIRVDYKQQTKHGDVLDIYVSEDSDKAIIRMDGEDGKTRAIVEFRFERE